MRELLTGFTIYHGFTMACLLQLLFTAIATNFMFVTIRIIFCQLSVQAFFHPLHQVKAWTFPNITHATSLLSSTSQARTSSYFSFTASFGFVIFNTIKQRPFKSFQIYFDLFFTKLQSVHDSPEFLLVITKSQPKLNSPQNFY